MIRLEGIAKAYVGPGKALVAAVRDLDLTVEQGETLCLVGASGCGKTTTLRLINRLVEPTAGRVLIGGCDASAADPVRLRRGMGYVIQRGGLFPHMTVAGNIGLLCRLEGWEPERTDERVHELLELVHLDGGVYAGRYPRELSGGQAQRVSIARALALDPAVLLLDEPFGALDPITRADLQAEFVELSARVEKTVVLVTHDLDVAFRLGDRVGLMSEGRLVQVGVRADFESAPSSDYVRQFMKRHLYAR